MSPAQGRDTVLEAGFYCDIYWNAEGQSYFKVRIPSTKEQYSVIIDEEFKADCTETVNELIEAVTQDTLAVEECACEHDKTLRNYEERSFSGEKVLDLMGGDETWLGCGHCTRCDKCKRRIDRRHNHTHAWWCHYPTNRYKPVFMPPALLGKVKPKGPAPAQMSLF